MCLLSGANNLIFCWMTVCQRHLLVHGLLDVIIPLLWASPSHHCGHPKPTTLVILTPPPWASHHHTDASNLPLQCCFPGTFRLGVR